MNAHMCYLRALLPALLIVAVMADPGPAAPPADYSVKADATKSVDLDSYFDANTLLMFIDNTGSFAYDKTALLGQSDGLHFPRLTNKTAMFAAGLWVGAKVNGETRVTMAEYSSEYVPGPMAGGTFQGDNPAFRVYKINRGDTPLTNPDYAEWPFADGAPAMEDGFGNTVPRLLGKQSLWTVFNDANPSAHTNDGGNTPPLGVEVQLYAHGDDLTCETSQAVFLHYTIINKGSNLLEDAYISLWADPDLGDPGNDLVGCDTIWQIGYCYNDGFDDEYGARPPVVGVALLQGPTVPSPGDSAWVFNKGGWVHGHRNLPMTAFAKYINGTDPHGAAQSYNYMQGLTRDGDPMVNPTTGLVTPFAVSGNPISGAGWVDEFASDRRLMMSCGPLTMAPNDTQHVVAAVVFAAAEDGTYYDYEVIDASHVSGNSTGQVSVTIADPAATTGHDYRVTFSSDDTDYHYEWTLTDVTAGIDVLTGQTNQSGNANYEIVDGLRVKVTGEHPGVGGWSVPNGQRRFTWVQSGDFDFEGFHGAIGWNSPNFTPGYNRPPVPRDNLVPVLLKLAPTDESGGFDPDNSNVSYAYRYGRKFDDPPARPEFSPYIVNPDELYAYQDFSKSVPLSAWDVSVDPPRRLVVGHLENNVVGGSVDGRYWPPDGFSQSNTSVSGPREWLWIFDEDYTEVADPSLQVDVIFHPLPIMYWLVVARRNDEGFNNGDEFLIIPNSDHNTEADVFTFTAPPPSDPVGPVVSICEPGIPLSAVAELRRVTTRIRDTFKESTLPAIPVEIDILPGECPNRLLPATLEEPKHSIGTLAATSHPPSLTAVAVLGSKDIDVLSLDPATFHLEGIAPMRWSLSDVSAPIEREASCDCGTPGTDGFVDLVLYYNSAAVSSSINTRSGGHLIEADVVGLKKSGLYVNGSDCLYVTKTGGTALSTDALIPTTSLHPNYPNPFNASTVIGFTLSAPGPVQLEIFDVLGRRVTTLVDSELESGPHQIEWNGTDARGRSVASGMYFYRLTTSDFESSRKMVILK